MAGLLQDIRDNQGIALLYLSDDLDSQERALVEQRLAGDPELRQCVEQMRQLQQCVSGGLAALDAAQTNPIAEAAAIRRLGKLMTQHQLELTRRPATVNAAGPRKLLPRWAYPLAAAAAVAFVLVGLSAVGVFDFPLDELAKPSHLSERMRVQQEALAADLQRSLDVPPTGLDDADYHLSALRSGDEEEDFPALKF